VTAPEPALRIEPLDPVSTRRHLFTVDVEDYFQVVAFEPVVRREEWDSYPDRVESNTDRMLGLLAAHGVQGTFFTLGWVARKHPALVRRIVAQGHEIASHGDWHRRVTRMSRQECLEELRSSKAALEDASGQPCIGFRAPSFSIVPGAEWAFDLLLEAGYRYDSSLFPIRRPDYGYPGVPLAPFWIRRSGGALLELPLATFGFGGMRLPAAGGAYLRQFPAGFVRRAFREAERDGRPGMFYVHPWEVDPEQPRIPCGPLTAVRHYRNIHLMYPRMEQLLGEFRFSSVAAEFAGELGLAGSGAAA